MDTNCVEILVELMDLPSHLKKPNQQVQTDSIKLPMYIKYAIRCTTSCVRHPNGID